MVFGPYIENEAGVLRCIPERGGVSAGNAELAWCPSPSRLCVRPGAQPHLRRNRVDPSTAPVCSFFLQKAKKPKAVESVSKPDVGEGKALTKVLIRAKLRRWSCSFKKYVLLFLFGFLLFFFFNRIPGAIKNKDREARGNEP